jgi:hypothetical protein
MEHTEEQIREVKSKISALRERQLKAAVPTATGIAALLAFADQATWEVFGIPVTVWGPVAAACVGGVAVFLYRSWRCPACDEQLGTAFSSKRCPKCGVPLGG